MNDLSNINHDIPLSAITPHPHALPPEPILPTHDVPPLHLVGSRGTRNARSRRLFPRTKKLVDGVLILALAVGHVQDRTNEGS